jgi:hypothetical protein
MRCFEGAAGYSVGARVNHIPKWDNGAIAI